MKYSVKASDNQGRDVVQSIEAGNKTEAAAIIREQGLFPYDVQRELSPKEKTDKIFRMTIAFGALVIISAVLIYAGTHNIRTRRLAIQAYRNGQYRQAISHIERTSDKSQRKPASLHVYSDSHFQLAQVEHANGNYATALDHLLAVPLEFRDYRSVATLLQTVRNDIARIEEEARRKRESEQRLAEARRHERMQRAANPPREDRIRRSFSLWNGSHRGVTDYIKKVMNDPKSYEHIETSYSDRDDHLIVKTRFRGRNAFGGMVVNTIVAKTDLDGNVLDVISFGQ